MKEHLTDKREIDGMEVENLKEDIGEVLEDSNVEFAYLHGSRATGKAHGESDLNIAVYTENKIRLKEQARLETEIRMKTGVETDLSVLNGSGLGFQHQVVKKGEVIYSVKGEERKKFEEELYRKYLDIKPLMKRFNEARRQKEGKIVKTKYEQVKYSHEFQTP